MKKVALAFLTSLALVLTACSGTNTPKTQEFTLEANAMKYQPAQLEVMIGQPVKITFNNTDVVDHDFSIMEFPMEQMMVSAEPVAGHDMSNMSSDPQLHIAVMMGQSGVMEFTPTKAGTYEFFCTVPGHKEAGMKGTLVVKNP